ncbi:hypothetical protein B296_00057387 [Ensete ventricosum]|uniref:Uncharacterized protein n=1 Tax=Ensete ventricosum TaxID=4639 RepID=A0A426XRB8_ENSVE|nr:hypothetical protein B296_00057387 [Ensete ventricosum]
MWGRGPGAALSSRAGMRRCLSLSHGNEGQAPPHLLARGRGAVSSSHAWTRQCLVLPLEDEVSPRLPAQGRLAGGPVCITWYGALPLGKANLGQYGSDIFKCLFIDNLDQSILKRELGTLIRILNYARYEMLNKALESFGDLGDDEELGPADWPTVFRLLIGECLKKEG